MTDHAIRPFRIRRADKLRFASPHGILYALPISVLLWVIILACVGVIR